MLVRNVWSGHSCPMVDWPRFFVARLVVYLMTVREWGSCNGNCTLCSEFGFFFPELLYCTRLLLSSYSEVSSQPENHTSDTWQYTVLQAAVIGRVSRLHVLSNDMFQFMFSSSRCSPIINQSKSSNIPSLKNLHRTSVGTSIAALTERVDAVSSTHVVAARNSLYLEKNSIPCGHTKSSRHMY